MRELKGWADPSHHIEYVHVAEDVIDLEYTREILDRLNLSYNIVPVGDTPMDIGGVYPENLKTGKKHLFLCENRGDFFKPCPATTEYECCDYQVLNIGANCPIDCVYCILQAYLNNPWLTAFVNIEKMFDELDVALTNEPKRFFRIGTGEFTDSLALESITHLSRKLTSFLSGYENVLLELKTKSASINTLKSVNHKGKTILSWSLNSPEIMKSEEIRSATLEQRLKAAKQATEWGYKLSFHFDPIIYHENWRQGYEQTIDQLFSTVPAESIVWISLGGLRYLPNLKPIGLKRFPHSRIFFQEFITGLDSKPRYFRSMREEMYVHIVECLNKRVSGDTCVYFCMESELMWERIFGFTPQSKGGIGAMLDKAALLSIIKR